MMLKKQNPCHFWQGFVLMVAPLWVEHSTNGFWFVWLSPLPGLCLHHNNLDDCFRWVPSSLYTFNKHFYSKLRSALPCALLPSGFTEFDTIPYAVSKRMAQFLWVRCSNQAWAKGPKLLIYFHSFNFYFHRKCGSTVEANFTTFYKPKLLIN